MQFLNGKKKMRYTLALALLLSLMSANGAWAEDPSNGEEGGEEPPEWFLADGQIYDKIDSLTGEDGPVANNTANIAKNADAIAEEAEARVKADDDIRALISENGGSFTALDGKIRELDTRINRVGAGAAALAALHPLDFDPDDKLVFSVGVGHYRNTNSGAIGAFYRPDEKTMFNIGGTLGNAENMFNFGLSLGLDRSSKSLPSRAVLNKELVALRAQVGLQDKQIEHQNEKISQLTAMVEQLMAKK